MPTSRPLRVFAIGNSFSRNATLYLPQIAQASGYQLHLERAEIGGCSLERHWRSVEAAEKNLPAGKLYKDQTQTLRELLGDGDWDIVTLQQASILSSNLETYRPYIYQLCDYVRNLAPRAEIVLHQTWAYRLDARLFGEVGGSQHAQDPREMWEKLRAAYHAMAEELKVRLIPVGAAFYTVDTDAQWGYKIDPNYDFDNPKSPQLPDQTNSLYQGYYWNGDGELAIDPKHTTVAGSYLGGLVWYGFLFGQSPLDVTFAPEELSPAFAAFLREVAAQTLQTTASTTRS